MKKTTEKSAGVFLYNEKTGKFLLLKRSEGSYWEFPKGHIEKRETHKDTLKRELREETGMTQFDILGRAGRISFVLNRKEDWEVLRIINTTMQRQNKRRFSFHLSIQTMSGLSAQRFQVI